MLKGLPTNFLGINPTGWVLHPFTFLNPEKRFEVLAFDDNRKSQIVATKDIVGTLFPMIKKYNDTMQVAQNFLTHYIKVIYTDNESQKISIFVD